MFYVIFYRVKFTPRYARILRAWDSTILYFNSRKEALEAARQFTPEGTTYFVMESFSYDSSFSSV
jgi:hypothetical protein